MLKTFEAANKNPINTILNERNFRSFESTRKRDVTKMDNRIKIIKTVNKKPQDRDYLL